jgi:hypothetical protein
MSDEWRLALTLAVPAFGALLGSWVGARLALRRFREERIFDRRLEWIERVQRAAKEAYDAWGVIYVHHQMGKAPDQSALDAQQQRMAEFTAAASLVRLYGSIAVRAQLQPIMDHFGQHGRDMVAKMVAGAPRSEVAALMHAQMKILLDVSNIVTDHGRKHLGIRD